MKSESRLPRAMLLGAVAAGLLLLAEPALQSYQWLPGVRGDLLAKLGRHGEARGAFEQAAALARNARERALLLERAAEQARGGQPG